MNKSFDILVVGEINADLVLRGDIVPAFNQVEKIIDDAVLTIGSSSAIFACAAVKLGLSVALIGKIGNDEFGHFMLRSLRERGIDVSGVIVDPAIRTGLSIILNRGTDRAILTYPGSINLLRFNEIDLSFLSLSRHLHVGSYFLLDALQPDIPQLFSMAQQAGLTTSLDTNYDPSEQWNHGLLQTLEHTTIFLPNLTELLAIINQSTLEAALEALSLRVPIVAVKLGENGAIARQNKKIVHADALKVQVVDTVGAGDTFNAGFLYGWLSGWSLDRALHLGCIAGSLSTRASGGTNAQPTLQETEVYLSKEDEQPL